MIGESEGETNVYDMRLTQHEDGFIYGTFCVERKDPKAPPGDLSSAIAQCGLVRTKDLEKWERLPDIESRSAQQRNVVLHPELVGGKYAFLALDAQRVKQNVPAVATALLVRHLYSRHSGGVSSWSPCGRCSQALT